MAKSEVGRNFLHSTNRISSIEIYELTGKLCVTQSVLGINGILDISQLSPGIYVVMSSDNPVDVWKLIKE